MGEGRWGVGGTVLTICAIPSSQELNNLCSCNYFDIMQIMQGYGEIT